MDDWERQPCQVREQNQYRKRGYCRTGTARIVGGEFEVLQGIFQDMYNVRNDLVVLVNQPDEFSEQISVANPEKTWHTRKMSWTCSCPPLQQGN
jgi:hypothetical protein